MKIKLKKGPHHDDRDYSNEGFGFLREIMSKFVNDKV
jgi:hypothetical protein